MSQSQLFLLIQLKLLILLPFSVTVSNSCAEKTIVHVARVRVFFRQGWMLFITFDQLIVFIVGISYHYGLYWMSEDRSLLLISLDYFSIKM